MTQPSTARTAPFSALGPQPQTPILTVTLNPALDLASATDRVVPELKLRCDEPLIDPGGGGINVSRALARMDGQSTAIVALGGPAGARVEALMLGAGLDTIRLDAPGDTRESLTVTDRASGQQFRFVLPGPVWSGDAVAAACRTIVDRVPRDGFVVLSGSNPPGVPDDLAVTLAGPLQDCGASLVVDTSGAPLLALVQAEVGISVLRMNDAEAEGIAGRPLPGREDTADFASGLVAAGVAGAVIVARGRDGNIVATAQGCWHALSHDVPIVSRVGAGDSFVAGLTLGLARGWDAGSALGLGAAAASAAVMTPATELCRPEDVKRLFDSRIVTAM